MIEFHKMLYLDVGGLCRSSMFFLLQGCIPLCFANSPRSTFSQIHRTGTSIDRPEIEPSLGFIDGIAELLRESPGRRKGVIEQIFWKRSFLSRFLPVAPVPVFGGPRGRRTKRGGTPAILARTIDGPSKVVLFHNCRSAAERTGQEFNLFGIAHLVLTLAFICRRLRAFAPSSSRASNSRRKLPQLSSGPKSIRHRLFAASF
jgi:hypothetical protein